MTKKKTAKKNAANIAAKPKEDKAVSKEVCELCEYFRSNGEGAKRGMCHRYPSKTPTEIKHFCGEFK